MATKREITSWSAAQSKAIESYRAERGLTRAELAKKSGIPLSTLHKIIGLSSIADTEQLAKIASALGIKISTLFQRVEEIIEHEEQA